MEINAFENVIGVIANEDLVEGSVVCLTAHTFSADFGSQTDLPGVKVPSTADEAAKARYIVTFAVDNRPLPVIESYPQMPYALRGGFDQTANAPFSAYMHLTYPGNKNGLTISSGVAALAFSEGTFTLQAGNYVASADIQVVGASLVADYASGSGQLAYTSASAHGVNFETVGYDATTLELTVKSV